MFAIIVGKWFIKSPKNCLSNIWMVPYGIMHIVPLLHLSSMKLSNFCLNWYLQGNKSFWRGQKLWLIIFFTINIANLNMLISNDRIKAAAKNLKKTFVTNSSDVFTNLYREIFWQILPKFFSVWAVKKDIIAIFC